MRLYLQFTLLAFLFVPFSPALAQNPPGAAEEAAALRSQLVEVKARQEELRLQVRQLDEQMKPENIQHSLAGIGSTRPEELREQHRRQLEIQKLNALSQLEHLAISQVRLEAAIATADALAYQQSAQGFPSQVFNTLGGLQSRVSLRWIVYIGLIAMLGIGSLIILARRMAR